MDGIVSLKFMAEEISITQELIRGSFTVGAVFVGAWMALRTYRTNQWWDSRHKTYQKAVKKLEQLKADLRLYRIRLRDISGSGELSQEKKAEHQQSRLAYLRTAHDLRHFVQVGRFNMSEPARKILLDLVHKELPPSDGPLMLLFEAKFESASESFLQAAHSDLQILTLFQRLGIACTRVKRFASWHGPRVAYQLERFAMIVWHGYEKGKRLSDIALATRWKSKAKIK